MDDCLGSHLSSRQGRFCLPHRTISHASRPIIANSHLSVQLVLNGGGRHAVWGGERPRDRNPSPPGAAWGRSLVQSPGVYLPVAVHSEIGFYASGIMDAQER